jgi:hypothetical protein
VRGGGRLVRSRLIGNMQVLHIVEAGGVKEGSGLLSSKQVLGRAITTCVINVCIVNASAINACIVNAFVVNACLDASGSSDKSGSIDKDLEIVGDDLNVMVSKVWK